MKLLAGIGRGRVDLGFFIAGADGRQVMRVFYFLSVLFSSYAPMLMFLLLLEISACAWLCPCPGFFYELARFMVEIGVGRLIAQGFISRFSSVVLGKSISTWGVARVAV